MHMCSLCEFWALLCLWIHFQVLVCVSLFLVTVDRRYFPVGESSWPLIGLKNEVTRKYVLLFLKLDENNRDRTVLLKVLWYPHFAPKYLPLHSSIHNNTVPKAYHSPYIKSYISIDHPHTCKSAWMFVVKSWLSMLEIIRKLYILVGAKMTPSQESVSN